MAIVITEKFGSGQATAAKTSSAEIQLIVTGSNDTAAIEAAILADGTHCPATYLGLPRTAIKVGPPLAEEIWEASVQYGDADQNQSAGDSQFNFEISGESQHIEFGQSSTVFPTGKEKHSEAINYDGEKVNGCDIIIPKYCFSETWLKADADVDTAYKTTLSQAVGTINIGTFKGFAVGEVLFAGVQGTRKGTGLWELTFRFMVSYNKDNFTVAGITGVNKAGWEYLWVEYQKAEAGSGANKVLSPSAVAVHVMSVYDYSDFAAIEIGTT